MFLIALIFLMAACVLYAGWKFYRLIDWEEPPDPSPDRRAMHKKEAELLHIQDVLEEAAEVKKLSQSVVDEFKRFCITEIQGMHSIEQTWRDRHKKNQSDKGDIDE